MHLILHDESGIRHASGIRLNTGSERKILIKATLVYKPQWGSRRKKSQLVAQNLQHGESGSFEHVLFFCSIFSGPVLV